MIHSLAPTELAAVRRHTEQLVHSEGWAIFKLMAKQYEETLMHELANVDSGEKALKLSGQIKAVQYLVDKPETWLKATKP